MSKIRRGFTLIEIALFLAVTGALFAGIMIGTQNSIWQQRYNDTIQNFANFLRNVYSEVSNPQGLGDGRSDQAIYGKLISFGQTYGLDGEELAANDQKVFVYDVVGDATGVGTGSVAEALKNLGANVVVEEKDNNGITTKVVPAGIAESYSPIWSSVVEATTDDGGGLYKGSILIVRHPRSGTINTLVSSAVIEVNKEVQSANYDKNFNNVRKILTSKLSSGAFSLKEANLCVNPYGIGETGAVRRNIRIIENARNASGVEIINADSNDNKCLD